MEYSISEASRILKTTRKTVYNKIEKLEGIQGYIKTRGKNKYINDEGIELIRKSLLNNCKVYTTQGIQDVYLRTCNEVEINSNASNNNNFNEYTTGCIQDVYVYTDKEVETNDDTSNKNNSRVYTSSYTDIHIEYINSLKSQIEELNKQLEVKDKHIESQNNHIQALTKLNENNQVLLSQAQQKIYLVEGVHQDQSKKPWWKKLFN